MTREGVFSLLPRAVKEIMTKDVATIDSGKTALEAARLMTEKGVGRLPVLEKGKLVGIITERDLVVKIIAKKLDPSKVKVKDFMTKDVISCSPDSSLVEVAEVMERNKIRGLPVLEKGKLVGIVTTYDLAVYGLAL